MKGIRKNFERFCYKNYNKGIPNLMLYIAIGTAIVYAISSISGNPVLYSLLSFDPLAIRHGQIWRLITFIFVYDPNPHHFLTVAISLLCSVFLGKAIEGVWGTFKFNLFYFTGVVILDLFGMITMIPAFTTFLNMSLFLCYATMYPDSVFLLFFILPVKAWLFALLNVAETVISLVRIGYYGLPWPFFLLPLLPYVNYVLFFGKDVVNVLPMSWRMKFSRGESHFRTASAAPRRTGSIPFDNRQSKPASNSKPAYTHKCTVCGRTDISNPELEFRYCSKCNGYYCYCEDHINHHEHIK